MFSWPDWVGEEDEKGRIASGQDLYIPLKNTGPIFPELRPWFFRDIGKYGRPNNGPAKVLYSNPWNMCICFLWDFADVIKGLEMELS